MKRQSRKNHKNNVSSKVTGSSDRPFYQRPLIWAAGIAVAAIGAYMQDVFKGAIINVSSAISDKYCEMSAGIPKIDHKYMTVLLAKLDKDDDSLLLNRIESSFITNEHQNIRFFVICKRFSRSAVGDLDQAIKDMISEASAELERNQADLLIFGNADKDQAIYLWFAGRFGGCEEKPLPFKLNLLQELSNTTKLKLISVASQQIVAACNNRETANWNDVAFEVDKISQLVRSSGIALDEAGRFDVFLEIYGLSIDRFSRHGEQSWFERGINALDYISTLNIYAKDQYKRWLLMEGKIAFYYYNYSFLRKQEDLKKGIKIYMTLRREAEASKKAKYINQFGDQIVKLIDAGVSAGLATEKDVEGAKSAID